MTAYTTAETPPTEALDRRPAMTIGMRVREARDDEADGEEGSADDERTGRSRRSVSEPRHGDADDVRQPEALNAHP